MKVTTKMDLYEPPQVEVIEVEVERGFAVSGWTPDSNNSEFGNQG